MGLREYKKKRDFKATTEPKGKVKSTRSKKLRFVVQEHHATRLHFDFRLEMDGVLRSWAVPKGPSMNPGDKRLAMMVEDHPLEYGGFAGTIPEGNYGAGEVRIWDKGYYTPLGDDSAEKQVENEKIIFTIHGKKLKGEFHLFRMKGSREENAWLLFKAKDKYADPDWEMETILPYGSRSEKPSGLTSKRVWISNHEEKQSTKKKATRSNATKKLVAASKAHKATVAKKKTRTTAASKSRTRKTSPLKAAVKASRHTTTRSSSTARKRVTAKKK